MYSKRVLFKIACVLIIVVTLSFGIYFHFSKSMVRISKPKENNFPFTLNEKKSESSVKEADKENEVNIDKENEEKDETDVVTKEKHIENENVSVDNSRNVENPTEIEDVTTNNLDIRNITDCPAVPPNLVGSITVNKTIVDRHEVEEKLGKLVLPGGSYAPSCRARDRVAIIIPYRNRESQLSVLLNNLHEFLIKQQIQYTMYLVEQTEDRLFNRATLFNCGVVEALKDHNFDCFIFHDVDLLPENDHCLYTCPESALHMSGYLDVFDYALLYKELFGGVCAIPTYQFKNVNGFSNVYWGWGGEDDDMFNRLDSHGYKILRYSSYISKYTMLRHAPEKPNDERALLLESSITRSSTDGLNSLRYELEEKRQLPLYTRLLVNLTNTV